jgi:hypothetical protein
MPHTLTCPECAQRFTATTARKLYCTPACSKAYNNRHIAEGQRIIGLAKAWRAGRSIKDPALRQAAKDAFSQLCRELDALVSDDTAAGRMHPTKVYARREARGLLDHQGVINRPRARKAA